MASSSFNKPSSEFRKYLPDLSTPRFTVMKKQNSREYAHDFKTLKHPPWLHALYMHWLRLYQEPFKGVTVDGMQRTMFIGNIGLHNFRDGSRWSVYIARRRSSHRYYHRDCSKS